MIGSRSNTKKKEEGLAKLNINLWEIWRKVKRCQSMSYPSAFFKVQLVYQRPKIYVSFVVRLTIYVFSSIKTKEFINSMASAYS